MVVRVNSETASSPGRSLRAAGVWALTVLALGAVATAASSASAAPARSDSVLVKVDPDAGARGRADIADALDADATQKLMAGWTAYDLPDAVTLPAARALLADTPAAGTISLDQKVHAFETPNDTYFSYQWPLQAIHAPAGWDASTGAAPVTVAVIDTGVNTSQPDLAGRIWHNPGEIAGNGIDDDHNGKVDDAVGWNFADWNNQVYSSGDGDTHGTHVSGTIAAQRGNSAGIAGVADNARIMPLKFLKPGGGSTSDAITAIQYAVANGAKVINASWGGPGFSQPLCDAVADAGTQGVLFVVAAGNDTADNDTTSTWPANCPATNLISVAATDSSDALASFSNYGRTQVDLGAPGDTILSTLPGNSYGYKSGTSMAAPHVAGVAAVVLGKHPGLTPSTLRADLMQGGRPTPALTSTTVSGRRLDLLGSLSMADGIGPDLTPPDPFGMIAPSAGTATNTSTPVFRWSPATDARSGISTYRLTVDGATVATVPGATTSTTPSTPLGEGTHTWSVVATDDEGNSRAADGRLLVVDRTAPSIASPASPANTAKVAGPAVRFTWTAATDAGSGLAGYRLMVNGVAVANTNPGETTSVVRLTPGHHVWQVVARDQAGNESTSSARGVFVGAAGAAAGARQRLTIARPSSVRSGVRPTLRVTLTKGVRVSFSARRASGGKVVASQIVRMHVGRNTVVLSRTFTRKIAARGVYVITARASGMRDAVRLSVRPRT